MPMTREQFDALVKTLEDYAQQKPAMYKLRLGLLALLGYSYIFLVLAGLLAVLVGSVLLFIYSRHINTLVIKFVGLLTVPIFVILRSLKAGTRAGSC